MTSRERFLSLLKNHTADRPGYWTGSPHKDAMSIYCSYFGVQNRREFALKLGDDFAPLSVEGFWKHPEGKPIFDVLGGKPRISLGQPGVFAECEDIAEVERFDWPNPDYIDYDAIGSWITDTEKTDMAIMGSCWMPFFHNVADFFGMENYFIKMHTSPEVVTAVTEHVVEFYMEVNRRFFNAYANRIDGIFIGNDFGSQLSLLISPNALETFVMPYFRKIISQAKGYGLYAMLHSCGAIERAIPMLIDAGIDALHPLQAKANGMNAENLAKYKNDLLFVGGVDTQQLLPFGTAQQVTDEVHRLRDIFGAGWVVSPSHEALLPNVPPENVWAMRQAAMEKS